MICKILILLFHCTYHLVSKTDNVPRKLTWPFIHTGTKRGGARLNWLRKVENCIFVPHHPNCYYSIFLNAHKICCQLNEDYCDEHVTLSMYPTRAVGVWYLSQALKLYVTFCLSSWSTHVACLYNPGIRWEPFLDGSASLFLPAFLKPYVGLTGFVCSSSTKSLRSYVPGTGVSCCRKSKGNISWITKRNVQ